MTTANPSLTFVPLTGAHSPVATAPPPRRKPPVFINDAVTPVGGETLLLMLLRAQTTDADDQP